MSQAAKLYMLLACLGVILAFLWSPLRTAVGGLISAFLTPAFLGTLKTVFLWAFWMMKKVATAHLDVLRNLVRPRRVIFPSLEDDDERKL